jgi:site-specific DNA-methyltransferase (adenine-specific)
VARHRLIIGDARGIPEVEDASVQLVVTSPPYWQLKDYAVPGQIGFREDYAAYHASLEQVWGECVRVLSPGCRIAINVGDQFTRAATYGRYKVMPLHAEIVLRMEALGVDFMGSIIWQKVTTCHTTGGGAVMGSFPLPRNGIVKFDYEHVLLFKKQGKTPPPSDDSREQARLSVEEWNRYFAGHWSFAPERGASHLAPFPIELPRRLIRMFTFPGERVLDPFVGSGTTLLACEELDRSGIGVELDPSLEPSILQRLRGDHPLFASEAVLDVTTREGSSAAAVPDSEAGPERDFFGSVVGREDRGRQRRPGVRDRLAEVLGPHRLRTRKGRVVILLGTRPLAGREEDASARLEELARGKGLLLTGRDGQDLAAGEEVAYVHGADRTFLNSRLIREGLLDVDPADTEHRHYRKFLREAEAASR